MKEVKCLGGICYLRNMGRMTIFFVPKAMENCSLKNIIITCIKNKANELEWVDFVVWTKKGISVQRIPFSSEMWEKMLPRLKAFYLNGILPELFTSRVRRGISLY